MPCWFEAQGKKVSKHSSSAPEYGEPWKDNLLYHFFDPSSVQVPEFYFVPRLCSVHNGFPQELLTEIFPFGYRSLSVPAGSFHCYHHAVSGYRGGVLPEGLWFDVEGEWYEWFAPGIGLVQIHDFTGYRLEGYPSVYIRLNRAYVNGFSYPNSDTAIRETTWGKVKRTLK